MPLNITAIASGFLLGLAISAIFLRTPRNRRRPTMSAAFDEFLTPEFLAKAMQQVEANLAAPASPAFAARRCSSATAGASPSRRGD
jgi:hypothetical protein